MKLLEDLQCDVMLLTAENKPPVVEEILSKRAMRIVMISTLKDTLRTGERPVYPFNKTYTHTQDERFVVLHTSGSTGLPKPVILSHGTLAHHDLFLNARSLGGKPLNLARFSGKQVLLCLPPAISQCIRIPFSLFSLFKHHHTGPIAFTSNNRVGQQSASTRRRRCHFSRAQHSLSLILCTIPNSLRNLKRVRYVTFGGSPRFHPKSAIR